MAKRLYKPGETLYAVLQGGGINVILYGPFTRRELRAWQDKVYGKKSSTRWGKQDAIILKLCNPTPEIPIEAHK